MILLLAEHLEVPFRERNEMLLAAGHAPVFPEYSIEHPEMAPVREAIETILSHHEPNPAVVVDRKWNLITANSTMAAMTQWVDLELLRPPVNVMRVGLHPRGWIALVENAEETRTYFIRRLRRQAAITRDTDLAKLLAEVEGYGPPVPERDPSHRLGKTNIITPHMRIAIPELGAMSFFFTVANFGTALEVTSSELSIEFGFAADSASAATLRKLPRR
jgi:hypothetical protein